MNLHDYLTRLNSKYVSGIAREHAYRTDLETLIRNIVPHIEVLNEPAKVTDCGNPDYILTENNIPRGFIEAKDVGKDLNNKKLNKDQFDRYRKALDNLIITDYLWFQFFQNDKLVHEIRIGEIQNGKVVPLTDNFSQFESLIKEFVEVKGVTIKSPQKLAKMMAGKARLLQDILEKAITSDEETLSNTELKGQYETFKNVLVHDLTPKGFSDMYAQTLAYGMFAARLHDDTLGDFSRQEASELIPKSNPFLRKLFQEIAGPDIDERIVTVVNNLAAVFNATDIKELLKNFGQSTQANDPIIHFYETFLSEYDSKLRKAKGVWYTPEPVVKFMVRAVDDILKTEFGLSRGIADTSKTKIKVKTDIANKNYKSGYKEVEKEVHKVQILDPATGTGTFLAEIIKHIHKGFSAMQGAWPSYVEKDLIPRLNGFELLMASYAMAHLKLDLLLTETGYKPTINQRFKVYLTNSLEESHPDTGTLFSNWLSTEANEANHIKRDTPVMCVIGNPPYSGISSNNGEWISNLIEDYKYIDGVHFNERKHWLNDDYVKFLRYGQHYIEKNGSGVLAFINPHGFLDNPTFRGMRWHLLKTYDKIYTIDLHGNSKKKETAPDGSADINVFDIQQGVSINVFVKTGKKKPNELGKVLHYDLYGKRDFKYDFLNENSIQSIEFNELPNVAPNYFFVPKDFEAQESYEKGFKVNEFFTQSSVGFVSANDGMNISMTEKEQREKIQDILTLEEAVWRLKYNRAKDAQSWKYKWAKEDAEKNQSDTLSKVSYRPFDTRYTLYTGVSGGLYARPTFDTMQNFINGKNVGLNWIRPMSAKYEFSIFISQYITDQCSAGNKSAGAGISYLGPLYLYSKTSGQQTIEQSEERTPNLNAEIVKEIEEKLGLTFTNEKEINKNTFAPIDVLDYIYAVLHSPSYREKYKEFLKIDFPRVPYPENQDTFWELVRLGGEIRQIHLLESPTVEQYITQYPIAGDNLVSRKMSKNSPGYVPNNETHGKVYVNDEQYFDNVPLLAWEFYIGGYQPAQKWLKDRKGRKLEWEDIAHYQKIIVALTETNRIMKEINETYNLNN
jgi:predicted helicase